MVAMVISDYVTCHIGSYHAGIMHTRTLLLSAFDNRSGDSAKGLFSVVVSSASPLTLGLFGLFW